MNWRPVTRKRELFDGLSKPVNKEVTGILESSSRLTDDDYDHMTSEGQGRLHALPRVAVQVVANYLSQTTVHSSEGSSLILANTLKERVLRSVCVNKDGRRKWN